MAIVTGGYDGTVDEVQFAALLHRYSVVGPDDFKATTQAGDRIVAIGNGTALGPGTVDVASNLPTIQFTAATGTRWDLVVLRRDWQPPGGTSEIKIIEGGTAQAYPTVGTATNQWNRRPGIMDDQPLYLQQVNGTLLGTRIDLRVWGSLGDGLVANDALVKTYLDRVGTEVRIGGERWTYDLGANNVPQWVSDEAVTHSPIQVGNYSITGGATIESEGSRKRVTVDMNVTRTGNDATIGTAYAPFGAVLPAAVRGSSVIPKYLPVSLSGGGSTNVHATVFLNPVDGTMSIRGQSAFVWEKNALFSLNTTYYI